jgi:hypothetical protein
MQMIKVSLNKPRRKRKKKEEEEEGRRGEYKSDELLIS